ncbi:DUF481 domain-containing protein [bacterium]|nr:DUF481 domain-containing protein [bacterium]
MVTVADHQRSSRERFGLSAVLWLCVCLSCAQAAEETSELLILHSGDQLSGQSRSVEDGQVTWELRDGHLLQVPLEFVDRIDLDGVEPVSAVTEIPPAPAAADTAVTTSTLPGPDTQAEEPSWVESVPFLTPLHYGYQTVSRSYVLFSDVASRWTRRINFGGQFLDGNAQTDLLNMQVEFENGTPKLTRQIDVSGQWGRNQSRETANKWTLNSNFDWRIWEENAKWIMFFTAKNEYDRPANLDYRGTISTGYGYRFYNDADRRLITRFGPAYTIELFREPYDHRESPDLFGEVELRWPLSKWSSFEQKTRVQPSLLDFELVRVFATSALLMDLDTDKRWKLRLGFNFTYNSQPNPGRVPSDYVTSVSLVYTRK